MNAACALYLLFSHQMSMIARIFVIKAFRQRSYPKVEFSKGSQAKIQAEKNVEVQAKMDAKIQAENNAEIQAKKKANIHILYLSKHYAMYHKT